MLINRATANSGTVNRLSLCIDVQEIDEANK